MMMETPQTQRVMQQPYLQIMDYVFVVAMGLELGLKVIKRIIKSLFKAQGLETKGCSVPLPHFVF